MDNLRVNLPQRERHRRQGEKCNGVKTLRIRPAARRRDRWAFYLAIPMMLTGFAGATWALEQSSLSLLTATVGVLSALIWVAGLAALAVTVGWMER